MNLPFVSRGRYEDAVERLAASEMERKRLLDLLLSDGVKESRTEPVAEPLARADSSSASPDVVPFTTPFDRTEQRFAQNFPKGTTIPAKFRARVV